MTAFLLSPCRHVLLLLIGGLFDVTFLKNITFLKRTATLKTSESEMQVLIKPCNLPET